MQKSINDIILSGKTILNAWKKLFPPYLILWGFMFLIALLATKHSRGMPMSSTNFLPLIAVCVGVAYILVTSAVFYQMLALYKNHEASMWEGSKLYGWSFLGYYFILFILGMVLSLISLPFIKPFVSYNSFTKIPFAFTFTTFVVGYFFSLVFNFGSILIVDGNSNAFVALWHGTKFVFHNIKQLLLPTILLSILFFIINNMLTLVTNSSTNVLIASFSYLLSLIQNLWHISLVTLLYQRHKDITQAVSL